MTIFYRAAIVFIWWNPEIFESVISNIVFLAQKQSNRIEWINIDRLECGLTESINRHAWKSLILDLSPRKVIPFLLPLDLHVAHWTPRSIMKIHSAYLCFKYLYILQSFCCSYSSSLILIIINSLIGQSMQYAMLKKFPK